MGFLRRALSIWAACAGLALAWLAPHQAHAAGYTQLIVFGDSLSDVGNNGRYTAGNLWAEHLAGAYGVPLAASHSGGTDYAISGALITQGGTYSLPGQVATYLAAHPHADAAALYVIWGGGNDAFSTLGNPASGPSVATTGVASTVGMINRLYAAGARYFLIGEVPSTNLTPYVQSQGALAIAQQAAEVAYWNAALRKALSHTPVSGGRVWRYNAASGLSAIVSSPTHMGFTNVTTPCNTSCADPAHTLFWDSIHPGATGHAMIADAMLAVLTELQ